MLGSNQPSADDLSGMALSELLDWRDALSAELHERINLNPRIAEARDLLVKTNAMIFERVRPSVEGCFASRGKTHGSMTLPGAGYVVKADIPQTVKWDQEKLKEIAAGMDWATVQKLFKIEFTVPEAVYKATLPGELLDKLTAARTTKTGDIKINVERAAT